MTPQAQAGLSRPGALRRPAVIALAPFAGGLIFAALARPPAWPLVIAAVVLLGAAAAFLRRAAGGWLVLAALASAAGAWYVACNDYLSPADIFFRLDARFRPLRGDFVGVVVSDPEQRGYGSVFYFNLESVTAGGETRAAAGTLRASVYENVAVRYGDRLRVHGTAVRAKPANNPDGFDYRGFLWRRGAGGLLRANHARDCALLARGRGNAFVAASYAIKNKAAAVLDRSVGGDEGALLKGLTLGTRAEIEPTITEEYRAAGVIHLLAISGFNVSLVAFVLFLVLAGTRLPRPAANAIVLLFLPAYAVLTGFDPPVVRATIMGMLVLVAAFLERDVDILNVLAAAALVILAYNPRYVADASFLLSFAATLGLASLYRPAVKLLRPVPGLLRETAAATIAAQLAVLPLQLYFFFRLSPIALFSNLVMVPLSSVAVYVSLVTIAAGAVWPALGDLFGGAAWLAGRLLVLTGHWFSRGLKPLLGRGWDLQFWVPRGSAFLLAAAGFAAAAVFVKRWRTRAAAAVATVLALGLWLGPRLAERPGTLRLVCLDAGQADSTFVRFPNGKTMLVDAGFAGRGYDAGERVVAPFLHGAGVGTIDYLCVTHGDADHAGGAAYLVRNFKVREVWWPAGPQAGHDLDRLKRACADAGVRVIAAPARVSVGGAVIEKLWPDGAAAARLSANDSSTVLRITYGRFAALLAGDVGKEGQRRLLAAGRPLGADVLKAPHHGSREASWPPFIKAVNPRVVVFTAKAGAAKFPDRAATALVRRAGASYFLTGERGAARAESDGRRMWLTTMY